MCRNIKPLFNFEPPATKAEINAAALQYVRKVSGFPEPSHVNEHVFEQAIKEISASTQKLLNHLETHSPHKNREEEAAKARERIARRFGNSI